MILAERADEAGHVRLQAETRTCARTRGSEAVTHASSTAGRPRQRRGRHHR